MLALCLILPADLQVAISATTGDLPIYAPADAPGKSTSDSYGEKKETEKLLEPAVASSGRVKVLLNTTTRQGQRYPQENLHVVQKIHTQMNVGMVLLGLLAQTVIIPGSKASNSGTSFPEVSHPAQNIFMPALKSALQDWFQKPDVYPGPFENALYVRPDLMSLVYVDFSDEEPTYDFHLQTTVSRRPDSRGFFTMSAIPEVTCFDTYSKTGLTLEQWKADQYAEIDKRVQLHVQSCLQKVTAEFAHLLGA